MRVFVALELPAPVREHLALVGGGIPGARWEPAENLHLTLRFIGELEGAPLRELHDALAQVRCEPFPLTLAHVGCFPPRGQPRVLWIGVDEPAPVTELAQRIDRAVRSIGLPPDARKFAPHVTLARLHDAPQQRLAAFFAHHGLLRTATFDVDGFALHSSVLGHGGAHYRVERRWGGT
ncbi:MAG: RNA 2',3'-cyclic phosphodiesterase [Deltaproteobacteria bacterium]|nr:RNA 2',3'-cyclic phosphodiesterase [Deltaproteobacteria bacterium]